MADRWSVLILRDIAICNQRTFRSILANNNERISSGVLAGRLKRLTDIGLLYFKDDPGHSQRKIYCLSPAAIDLVPILLDMSSLGADTCVGLLRSQSHSHRVWNAPNLSFQKS